MAQDWEKGICNERSGFLFSHACDQLSADACSSCGKPICQEHAHQREEGVMCTSCAKKTLKRARGRNNRRYDRDYYDDDPYFYSGYYYNGYGYYGHGYWGHHSYHSHAMNHDPNDFTEADGASMMHEADEDFESDMGES